MRTHFLPFLSFLALAGCQTYDFEPVKPLAAAQVASAYDIQARPLPPNIMLLLDKSGSMNILVRPRENVDGTTNNLCVASNCHSTGASDSIHCPTTCSTRINELRYAMADFLDVAKGEETNKDSRPLGKFGLAMFPTDAQCTPPDGARFGFATSDEPGALREGIQRIRNYISDELYNTATNDKPIRGGTPTAASLGVLRDRISEFQTKNQNPLRKNFILLLTDGLPNCNREQSDCPINQCICTANTPLSNTCLTPAGGCGGTGGVDNCLDRNTTVETIQELRERGIETIVIGFGAEVSGGGGNVDDLAVNVLNAMALAGGHVRRCDGVCPAYYPASNRKELLEALQEISKSLVSDPCIFGLEGKLSSPSLLLIHVDDKRIQPAADTFSYSAELNAVVFTEGGELCNRLKNSSAESPVKVSISVLQTDF